MKLFLRKLKNQIISEPIILLKKPWLVFLMPFLLSLMIYNRLKISETVVYLTESKLEKLSVINKGKEIPEKYFCSVTDYRDFAEYARERIREDPESGNLLLDVIKKRFDRGDSAIIYSNPEWNPLSYVFICTKLAEFTPVDIELQLPTGTFGMYDVYTFKNSRCKGYYSHLFYYAVDLMQKKGYDSMWLWLMKHNSASVKVHYKLGIRNISKILTEKVNLGFISRNVKDVKISLVELILDE
jgi:hypothetical protein